jgi:hypothetical protein
LGNDVFRKDSHIGSLYSGRTSEILSGDSVLWCLF